MITQGLLDFFSNFAADWLNGLPSLPSEVSAAVGSVSSSLTFLGSQVGKFGVIFPFDTVGVIVQWWLAYLAFWFAIAALRLVLWLAGR